MLRVEPLSTACTAHLGFHQRNMSTKHFYNSAEGLVDKAERGAIALNPALRL